jgi:hypothetical protein
MQTLNQALYRELRSDYPQDIFPKVACKRTELGDGDTFFSVQQIVTTINDYYFQCEKIAKLLKGKSLSISCRNVHQFLYSHFQYRADSDVQQLRSPACSWAQRFTGIDCKSYTILAGAILKAMGYNSFVRQIKQPYSLYPDDFSHVYLVVPISQEDNDLNKGYYVIDGTIPTMQETPYSDKSDEIVLAMKHIGLNGAQNRLFGFAPKKGLGEPSPKNKFEKGVDQANKYIGIVGDTAANAGNAYNKVKDAWNPRVNPANTSPTVTNNDISQLSQEQREYLRKRQEAERNSNANNHHQYQNYNQGNLNTNKPKDNTVIYVVVGGVVVLGAVVAITMMNKKK